MKIGLIAFFSALFAGISVYNFRRIPTTDRVETTVVTAAVFVVSLAIIRPFTAPASGGLLQAVHPVHVVIGLTVVVTATWICARHELKRPRLAGLDVR